MKGRDCIFEPPVTPDIKLDFNFFFFNRKGRKDAPFQTDVSNHFQNRTKFKFYSPGGTSPTPIPTCKRCSIFSMVMLVIALLHSLAVTSSLICDNNGNRVRQRYSKIRVK